MPNASFSRRQVFASLAAASAVTLTSSSLQAAAPRLKKQTTPVYHWNVGELQVTTVVDGFLDLEPNAFGLTKEQVDPVLAASHLNGPMRASVNTFLVNDGKQLSLIDTGSANAFGPNNGKLLENLSALGIKPSQIDRVLLTHLHPDHAQGLLTTAGAAAFPNAELVLHENEAKFWLSAEMLAKAPAEAKGFFQAAQKAAAPYQKRMRTFSKSEAIIKGITPEPFPGHTPGHSGYRLSSGNQQALIWGDIVHSQWLQFPKPEWTPIAFDADPGMAIATRAKVMDMVSKDGILIAGAHLTFPGLGFVEKATSGYRFVPAAWNPAV
jgi:glyoxylase-like metal-dependent hydrolase (beta-lactamase superfamily II)